MLRNGDQREHDRRRDARERKPARRREQAAEPRAQPGRGRARQACRSGRCALGARGGHDAIAQLARRLAVGHAQRQGSRCLERVLEGAPAGIARRDVPLGELRLVRLEHAEGVRADQRADLLGDLRMGAHA